MATWTGTSGNNNHDFQTHPGSGDDWGYGGGGHDSIWGWSGSDWLYGEAGNDWLYGENHRDYLYGGEGGDHVYGGPGDDYIWAGQGKDHIYGGLHGDRYFFDWSDTGATQAAADIIYDFNNQDTIYLKGEYALDDADQSPEDGEYTVYQSGTDWIVKYNLHDTPDAYHYIVVKGHDPHGDFAWF